MRWDPIYDAEGLKKAIADLASGVRDAGYQFYDLQRQGPDVCQGDIVEMPCSIPCIDDDGEVAAYAASSPFWMVVGNTCDMTRDISDVPWTQAVPLERIRREVVSAADMREWKEYRFSRRFYVPQWPESGEIEHHFLADFLRIVPVHRKAIVPSMVRARLARPAWVLLHSCLIRFLARDDGRFDP